MAKTITKKSVDTYMDLIQRCPLKTIKNEVQHRAASAMISELLGRKLDAGASDYFDAQILFVTKYEDETYRIGDFESPQEALQALMRANNMSQVDIAKIIGSESATFMFLAEREHYQKNTLKHW